MRVFALILSVSMLAPLSTLSAQKPLSVEVSQSLEQAVAEVTQFQSMADATRDSITAMFLGKGSSLRWRTTDSLDLLQQEPQQDSGNTRTALAFVLVIAIAIVIGISATSIKP